MYLTALQKQPPVRVNGVVGSVAMGICFGFVGFEINFYRGDGVYTCNSGNEAFFNRLVVGGGFY